MACQGLLDIAAAIGPEERFGVINGVNEAIKATGA